jgi:hypothetical protein
MSESQCDASTWWTNKLISYRTEPLVFPAGTEEWMEKQDFSKINRLTWIDNACVTGAFYSNSTMHFAPTPEGNFNDPPMYHDWDELLSIFSTNPDDSINLDGEVVFYLGNNKHVFTKTCAIFIPKGLLHGPLLFPKVNRPIITSAVGMTKEYTQVLPEDWERYMKVG